MGAPLDVARRSSLLLPSAQTLSTTLLGFEFLQRPQHVLSNLLDGPHASVRAGSSTIAFSSAFPLEDQGWTTRAKYTTPPSSLSL